MTIVMVHTPSHVRILKMVYSEIIYRRKSIIKKKYMLSAGQREDFFQMAEIDRKGHGERKKYWVLAMALIK